MKTMTTMITQPFFGGRGRGSGDKVYQHDRVETTRPPSSSSPCRRQPSRGRRLVDDVVKKAIAASLAIALLVGLCLALLGTNDTTVAAKPPVRTAHHHLAEEDFATQVLGLVRDAAQQAVQIAVEDGDYGEGEAESTSPPTGEPSAGPNTSAPLPTASPLATAAATAPPTTGSAISSEPSAAPAPAPVVPGRIEEGIVYGVDYYSCRASTGVERTILLFHGASMTREHWMKSGILGDLCGHPNLTVYAFDLSVASSAADLQALMDELARSNLIFRLPVDAIVTPSASGSMVVDWGERTSLSNASLAPMSAYWSLWIPVACPSVSYVDPPDKMSTMFPNVNILAVHGDQDTSGGRVMQLLETYAGATLVTIDGGHACYMQSPEDFVDVILNEMGIQ
jgi:pimeloyl-ACP methyl ester carboxylesterase